MTPHIRRATFGIQGRQTSIGRPCTWRWFAPLVGAAIGWGCAGQACGSVFVEGDTVPTPAAFNPAVSVDVTIGNSGVGGLTIDRLNAPNALGSLTSQTVIIGNSATGIGFAVVQDPFASWTLTDDMTVGASGIGRLDILDGGIVQVNFGSSINNTLSIGTNTRSSGTVVVDGVGSLLRIGGHTTVGNNGTAVLRILNEAFVDATNTPSLINDTVTVGLDGRIELGGGGWLRAGTITNNGVIAGSGRLDAIAAIANTSTGRIESRNGDRLVFGNNLTNASGDILIDGGEIEVRGTLNNSTATSDITMINAILRATATTAHTNAGLLATTGGVNDIYGTFTNNGRIAVAGQSTAVFHDTVSGNGTTRVFPGSTAVYLQNLSFAGVSQLQIDLAGTDGDTDYGQLEVAGLATLAGSLNVSLIDGFTPRAGDSFTLLIAGSRSGTLNLVSPPPLTTGLQWDLDFNANSVVLNVISTGDFNGNGAVDAADYVVWRNSLGQQGALPADGNGNGVVDQADYEFWRARFGNVVSGGSGGSIVLVPEPAAATLVIATFGLALATGHGNWRCARPVV